LNLRTATGANAVFTNAASVKSFLLNATATNMANMLSTQLAATLLDLCEGIFGTSTLIYVDGVLATRGGNSQGTNRATNLDNDGDTDNADAVGNVNQYRFASIAALIATADAELALHGTASSIDAWRAYQETLKIAFDDMNNKLAIFAL
jgi:hypothetical protein